MGASTEQLFNEDLLNQTTYLFSHLYQITDTVDPKVLRAEGAPLQKPFIL